MNFIKKNKLQSLLKKASEHCDCTIVWAEEGGFDIDEEETGWNQDQIDEDLVTIFNKSGIRMFFADDYYSCCVNEAGRVLGVLVYHQEGIEDVGDDSYPIVTFSIVTDPECGGRGIARSLISDFCKSNRSSIIKAEVLNPFLYRILGDLRFKVEKEGETISNKPIKYFVKYP
jgi:hypothetical protein